MLSNNQKITLSILLGNLFIAFLGIGLVIPVLPTIMNELNINGEVVGYMVAAFSLTQLIVSPLAGRAVDRFGRKIMIVLGLIVFGISELLFGTGQSVTILFISRILGGVSAAFIMPAVTAFIADVTTIETRPKALAYMSAAISTGFIIGPGIGGFLAEIHTRLPFYSAGVLGLLAAILSTILLREPTRQVYEEEVVQQSVLKKVFETKYLIAFVVIFIFSFGLAAFETLFSLYVDHKFAFTPKDIAIMITGGALFGAISQIILFDRLTKSLGEIKLIRYSLIFSAILTFAITAVSGYWVIMFVTFILFVGFDLMRPAVTNYLSKIAGNDQGFVGGMNSTFSSLGNIFGPIIGGILFDKNLNYPYYLAAIVLVVGVILTFAWKEAKTIHAKQ